MKTFNQYCEEISQRNLMSWSLLAERDIRKIIPNATVDVEFINHDNAIIVEGPNIAKSLEQIKTIILQYANLAIDSIEKYPNKLIFYFKEFVEKYDSPTRPQESHKEIKRKLLLKSAYDVIKKRTPNLRDLNYYLEKDLRDAIYYLYITYFNAQNEEYQGIPKELKQLLDFAGMYLKFPEDMMDAFEGKWISIVNQIVGARKMKVIRPAIFDSNNNLLVNAEVDLY